jgi:molybdopterin synthase sulfur carrier subunit
MIKVLFFAKLSEQLKTRELQVESHLIQDTDQLLDYLTTYNPQWSPIFKSQHWLKAVNQHMTSDKVTLHDGDEVAYFPPVTGG